MFQDQVPTSKKIVTKSYISEFRGRAKHSKTQYVIRPQVVDTGVSGKKATELTVQL